MRILGVNFGGPAALHKATLTALNKDKAVRAHKVGQVFILRGHFQAWLLSRVKCANLRHFWACSWEFLGFPLKASQFGGSHSVFWHLPTIFSLSTSSSADKMHNACM